MNSNIVNLTPHPLVFANGITIQSSGVARCTQTDKVVGEINSIPVVVTTFGEVTGLPRIDDYNVYVVSALAAQACRGRTDVFVPARLMRDAEGRVVACAALARIETPAAVAK